MPTPIDLQDTLVQIYTPATGTTAASSATIANVSGYSATHGTDGETRVRVFGQASPYVRAGELVDSYDLSGLYDPADTNGQNVLRNARDTGGTVILQILPDGVAGYRQECRITEYTDSGDADGEYVECSFTAEAVGAKTAV